MLALFLATPVLLAQGEDGPSAAFGRPRTLFEQFSETLKLDKAQVPVVQQILTTAGSDAPPLAQELMTLRERIMNAELTNRPDAAKVALDSYSIAAAKMAAIEASAFAKVYQALKPNQQPKATEAFGLLGGIFMPGVPSASRGAPPAGGGDR
ncbi:MAG: hypothetical protein ABI051_11420 [Vicinamibacterales bacterium]